ncbi:hypothetical protein V8C35DRAFT_303157 [Trichoderma chlorosporum]
MSGFELAGTVLNAFPIAISALEVYRKLADQLGLFFKIKYEYRKWRNDLDFHKLAFTKNLRELLLPLVADDEKIRELLLAPGGDCWKDESIARLFKQRLQDSYGLYMQYIQHIKEALDEINEVLAVNSELAQKLYDSPEQKLGFKTKLGNGFPKEWLELQIYKFKFSKQKNEAVRKRLFGEVQENNGRLAMLLKASDEDVRLMDYRESKKQSEIDILICGFWKKAKSAFQALANAWICQCQQHGAKLLLQHRITGEIEFDIALTGFTTSKLGLHKIKVSDSDYMVAAKLKEDATAQENNPAHQPGHDDNHNVGSNICGKSDLEANINLRKSLPIITLASANTPPTLGISLEITNLCSSFGKPDRYYGYLTGDDCRYYIYDISLRDAKALPSVTLDEILRGRHPLFTRSKRYDLSLVIASTYLQLLDSPWLLKSPKRADIIFLHSSDDRVEFDQPHINQNFKSSLKQSKGSTVNSYFSFAEALDHLGIMLLELCFGQIIEEQPYRRGLPAGQSEKEKTGFDVLAARDWQCHVNEEAGGDYAGAVSWCLGGNRSVLPEEWRQEMLAKVIKPLERCCNYLANKRMDL